MRLRALLILATTLLGVMALSGAALAASKMCSNNPCLGTNGADRLKGNATKNEIRGLRGPDYIAGKQRADELYGNRGKDEVRANKTAGTASSAAGEKTSSTEAAATTR
jgi:Ca2+-binding RTX toxin-like protein